MTQFNFLKAALKHKYTIFSWLTEPHVKEFWDNSPEHKEDILIFMQGRSTSSTYFNGIFTYWIGKVNNDPFSLIMTAEVVEDEDLPETWKKHLSKTGKTYSLDFCIGNKKYIGKGLAAPTLEAFTDYFQKENQEADTFIIDPDESNPRAAHLYEKAGFKFVEKFPVQKGVFKGQNSWLMIKK